MQQLEEFMKWMYGREGQIEDTISKNYKLFAQGITNVNQNAKLGDQHIMGQLEAIRKNGNAQQNPESMTDKFAGLEQAMGKLVSRMEALEANQNEIGARFGQAVPRSGEKPSAQEISRLDEQILGLKQELARLNKTERMCDWMCKAMGRLDYKEEYRSMVARDFWPETHPANLRIVMSVDSFSVRLDGSGSLPGAQVALASFPPWNPGVAQSSAPPVQNPSRLPGLPPNPKGGHV
jgi:hypothetical protein